MENINKLIHKKFKKTWSDKIPQSYSKFEKMIKKQNKFIFDKKTKEYKVKSESKSLTFRDREQLNNYIEANPYYLVGKKISDEGINSLNDADIAVLLATFTHAYDGRGSIFSSPAIGNDKYWFEIKTSDGSYDHSEVEYLSNVTDFFLKKFLLGTVLYTLQIVSRDNNTFAKVLFYMPENLVASVNILDELLLDEIDLTARDRARNYTTEVKSDESALYNSAYPIRINSQMSADDYIGETMSRLVTAKMSCVDENLNPSTLYAYSELLPSTILAKMTDTDFNLDQETRSSLTLYLYNMYNWDVMEGGRFYSDRGILTAILKNPLITVEGKFSNGELLNESISFTVKDYITMISSQVMFVVNGRLDSRTNENPDQFYNMYFNPYSTASSSSSIENSVITGTGSTDLSVKRYAGLIFHTDVIKKIPAIIFEKKFVTDSKEIKNRLGEISDLQFTSLKEFFAFFTGESVEILNKTYEEPNVNEEDKLELTKLFATISSEIVSIVNSISSSLTSSVSFEPLEVEQFGEDISVPYNQVYKQNFVVYNASNFSVNPAQSVGLFVSMFKKTLAALSTLLRKLALIVSGTLKTFFELLVEYINVIFNISVRAFLRLVTTTSVTKVKYMASETFNDSTYVVVPTTELIIPDRFKQSMLDNYLLGSVQEIIIVDENVSFIIKHITESQYVVNFSAVKFLSTTFGLGFYAESCITKEDWGDALRASFTQLIEQNSLGITMSQFNEYTIIENNYKAVSRGILDGTVSHIPIIGKFVGTGLSIQFLLSTLTSAELSEGYLQVFDLSYEQYVAILNSLKLKNYSEFPIIETEDYLLNIQELQTGMNVVVEEQGVFHSTIDSLVAYWAGRKLAHLFYLIARRIRYRKTLRINKSSIVEPVKEGQQELNESGLENSLLILAAITALGASISDDLSDVSGGGSNIYGV